MLVAPGVVRVLAPNPGLMTGPGTNSYLFGQGQVAVVDPGPNIPAHLDAIQEASRPFGRLTLALVTHWHSDHFPAALELQRRLGVRVAGHPTLARVDVPLGEGSSLEVGGVEVRVIETPGHSADHLCYLIPDRAALFSGDHVAGQGTTVIGPPDGNLSRYLDSLRRLLPLDMRVILPGHGPSVDDPRERVQQYLDHRLDRERQVLESLADGPKASPEMVARIYGDVPVTLHWAAARSLLAHLEKLEAEGRVARRGEVWQRTG
jgi:glyoxylase-like metal-dependent hydrolase (beta-lactamase superfamily II)